MERTISSVISDRIFGSEGLNRVSLWRSAIAGVKKVTQEEAGDSLRCDKSVIDLRGKLVLPALIDSHTHVLSTARFLYEIEVFATTGVDSLVDTLQSSPLSQADFVLAGRLNAAGWAQDEQRRIASALDAAFPNKPCLVKSVEQHSCFANSRAWDVLDIAGIAKRAGVPSEEAAAMRAGGRIHGVLYEELTTPLYDTFTVEQRREALSRVLDTLPRIGVGGLHALVGYGSDPAADIRLAMEIAAVREDLDVVVWPRVRDVAVVKELGLPRIGGCILLDGAIGARTAALSRPYDDDPDNKGVLYFTQEDFTRFAGECASAGLQLCVHAIGDAAIEQGLSAWETLAGKHDIAALRPRIDHWCLATPQQCQRAAKLGVASGMQPAFDLLWGGAQGAYYRALTDRALKANALKTAINAGMIIGGGSDAPITPLDPRLGVHAACRHTNPGERLSFEGAVRLFSEGSAALGKGEDTAGALKAGCEASFTVFAGDTDEDNIAGREALLTVHKGRVVWDSGKML